MIYFEEMTMAELCSVQIVCKPRPLRAPPVPGRVGPPRLTHRKSDWRTLRALASIRG